MTAVVASNDSSRVLTIDLDADSPNNLLCKRQVPIQINCQSQQVIQPVRKREVKVIEKVQTTLTGKNIAP